MVALKQRNRLTFAVEDSFDKMAKLKVKIKKLEIAYKDLEKQMVNEFNKKYKHKLGTFTPTERKNFIMDNCAVAKLMGMKAYKKHSTISKTGIEDGIGEKGFNKLMDNNDIVQGESSHYYIFRAAKK